MNKRKILSLLTALTISASAFAGLTIPASAETTVIDFDTTTITATEKGSSTTFEVIDATDVFAPALAAAGAGKVLQLGSSQNGASKCLGYTAALAKDEKDAVVEYSGVADLSFKIEPMQIREGRTDVVNVQFTDIQKTPVLSMEVGTSATGMKVNGNTVATEFGKYYVIEASFDFDNKKATIIVKDSAGKEISKKEDISISGENLAYLHFADTDWRYGYCALDDITLDATQIGAPVYYTATINTARYAKLTTSDDKVYHADATGKIEIPLLKPNTTFTYTLHKEGYTDVEGEVSVVDADFTDTKTMELTDDSTLFIESDFGSDNGEYLSAGGSRNDSISLGEYELPALAEMTVDLNFAGFGNYSGQQKTWALKTDGGRLVGLQISDNGLYAWTGWTGSANMNQSSDIGTYTQGVRLGDAPAANADFSVKFVLDTANKAIVALYGDKAESLTYTIDATKLTNIENGLYRYNGALATKQIKITEPDPSYIAIVGGNAHFAKISGVELSFTFDTIQTVVDPEDTFEWTVARDGDTEAMTGVTIDNDGVLSVTDAAVPGNIKVTVTGSHSNKTASKVITIDDFSVVTATVDGPAAMEPETTGVAKVTSLKDSLGVDVMQYFAPAFSSDNTEVATVDAATGVITAVAKGTANITVKIGNPGKEAEVKIPVKVGTYSKVVEATGDSTEVSIADIEPNSAAKNYQVTTATADGTLVAQTEVNTRSIKNQATGAGVKMVATYENGVLANLSEPVAVAEGDEIAEDTDTQKTFVWESLESMKPVTVRKAEISSETLTVDTTGAAKVEVAPIYEGVMNVKYEVPDATYNVTVTANNGRRTDVYANEQMLINNINQGSDNYTVGRIIPESAEYKANDIHIAEGYATFKYYDDQSGASTITGVKFVKAPSIVTRAKRIYVIGDSLVAKYYGDAPEGQENLVRTGWGDVLQNYITGAEVTNLGNSGAEAVGMYGAAFTNVQKSAQPGDIVIWESGYNDRTYSTVERMTEYMTKVADECEDLGVKLFFVNPNASAHDYNDSVVWASHIRNVAKATNTELIDLSALSYDFLETIYADDAEKFDKIRGKWNDANNNGKYDVGEAVEYPGCFNNVGDTLHSTYGAANCWAAIVASGLYANEDTRALVDTEHEFTFTDSAENSITAKVNTTDGYMTSKTPFAITKGDNITVKNAGGTEITAAAVGTLITVAPAANFQIDAISVNDGAVAVTDNGDGTYTFTMPLGEVVITVTTSAVSTGGETE